MTSKRIITDTISIYKKSVAAVLPDQLIRNNVNYNPGINQLIISNECFDLNKKNVHIVGTGKAVKYMAYEMEKILGSKIKSGIISVPLGSLDHASKGNVQYYEGAKDNLPDEAAETTSFEIKKLVTSLQKDDILLVLISGGGSALLTLPDHRIQLQDKYDLIKKLANAGADITELNNVRKKFSELKGGRLAKIAQPAQVVALILSDIVGDPLELIASGPTVHDQDKPLKAKEIIDKYNLFNSLPETVQSVLLQDSGNIEFPHENVKNFLIGSNKISLKAALLEATTLNYSAFIVSSEIVGNVKDVAKEYVDLAECISNLITDQISKSEAEHIFKSLKITKSNLDLLTEIWQSKMDKTNSKNSKICFIFGGETTVLVQGTGKGGRNQHLALEFSNILHQNRANFSNIDVYLLCAGTDGIDGPTNAAGAIGYKGLVDDAIKENLDTEHYLKNNDSYSFYKLFKNSSYHVKTGHTNTNVMDIHVMVISLDPDKNLS